MGMVLALCVPRFWLYRLRGPMTLERRALWGQATGRQLMAALGIRLKVTGPLPRRGILVSNHLSYLDILIYGTIVPCFFVSKAEVRHWPFFGWMSNAGGTLYVDRSSRESAESVASQIAARLTLPVMLLFFPEGTSTDGSQLLRFRSRLFTPAVDAGAPVTAAAIRYVPADGVPERELCWFGDTAFLPHLWRTLGGPGFTAEVRFGEPRVYTDRRAAADATQAEVQAMRSQTVLAVQ
jgi:1-acyl-sn-glycerol-3-phosphate acyltransferase